MCLIPLPERSSIDLDDCTLNKGVCPDKLVVGSVVNLEDNWDRFATNKHGTYNADNPGLLRYVLAPPGEVARLQSQSTVLDISAPGPDTVNTLGPQFCASWLTTELELSLLAVMGTLRARG